MLAFELSLLQIHSLIGLLPAELVGICQLQNLTLAADNKSVKPLSPGGKRLQ